MAEHGPFLLWRSLAVADSATAIGLAATHRLHHGLAWIDMAGGRGRRSHAGRTGPVAVRSLPSLGRPRNDAKIYVEVPEKLDVPRKCLALKRSDDTKHQTGFSSSVPSASSGCTMLRPWTHISKHTSFACTPSIGSKLCHHRHTRAVALMVHRNRLSAPGSAQGVSHAIASIRQQTIPSVTTSQAPPRSIQAASVTDDNAGADPFEIARNTPFEFLCRIYTTIQARS